MGRCNNALGQGMILFIHNYGGEDLIILYEYTPEPDEYGTFDTGISL